MYNQYIYIYMSGWYIPKSIIYIHIYTYIYVNISSWYIPKCIISIHTHIHMYITEQVNDELVVNQLVRHAGKRLVRGHTVARELLLPPIYKADI